MNEIIIKYKRIKNIYIRIKHDLNIHVTAPKRVSKKYIKVGLSTDDLLINKPHIELIYTYEVRLKNIIKLI